MTQTASNNPFLAAVNTEGEFDRLPDGCYDSRCCGVVVRDMPDFKDPEKTKRKVTLVFQVNQDGIHYYLKSKPLTLFTGATSALYILVNAWLGVTLDQVPAGIDCGKLVGLPAQLVVGTTTGRDNKQYASILNVLRARQGATAQIVPDAIPEFLVRGAIPNGVCLADGLTVKEPEQSGAQNGNPFAAQGVQMTNNVYVPSQAGGNPLQVQMPAPQPVTGATAPEGTSDLPF